MSKHQKYRTEGRAVYVLDETRQAYVFAGWLRGRTLAQFIRDYEEEEYAERVEAGGHE